MRPFPGAAALQTLTTQLDPSSPQARENRAQGFAEVVDYYWQLGDVNRELEQDVIFDPTVDPLKDLVASASQIAACDMVISATNAGVHTAGGLGVPCWALVPFESDWRWTWGRHDVLWYPGMRLFRQERLDETWGEVIDRVTHDFQSLLAGDRSYLRSPPADDLEW